MLVDVRPAGSPAKGGGRARRGRHHREQEHHPVRTASPFVTSGIRIGTPAVTTRGMKEAEMVEIGAIIDEALQAAAKNGLDQVAEGLRGRLSKELCATYPLYPEASSVVG